MKFIWTSYYDLRPNKIPICLACFVKPCHEESIQK